MLHRMEVEKVTDSEEDVFNILAHGRCQCGVPGEELHTCPYSEDINGNYETLCNCCSECSNQCAMDI